MNVGTQLTKAGALAKLKTLEDVVQDYRDRFDYHAGHERSEGHHDPVIDFCREADTIALVIRRAVDGRRRDGKMFSEGSCIETAAKVKFTTRLLKRASWLHNCTYFDAVYDIVREEKVKGIGNLTIYNVAARIAAWKGLHPEHHLYIHAGPLKGWKALTGMKGNDYRVAVELLPKALHKLPMHKVEDLLCEYREFLHPGLL